MIRLPYTYYVHVLLYIWSNLKKMTSKKQDLFWEGGWFGIIAWDAVPSACPGGSWRVVCGCGRL